MVISGVPQGSVLAPIMFLIYVNEDISDNSYINMFADDTKIQRRIIHENSCMELQEDINKIKAWSEKWNMEFNVDKCHVVRFGISSKRPVWQSSSSAWLRVRRSKKAAVVVVLVLVCCRLAGG